MQRPAVSSLTSPRPPLTLSVLRSVVSPPHFAPPAPHLFPPLCCAVLSVIRTKTSVYMRHSLPIVQARAALLAKNVSAAIVVDDSFSPLGVVYLQDIEVGGWLAAWG